MKADPVSIEFSGQTFVLRVSELEEGTWAPGVAEWLQDTALRRVVAVPEVKSKLEAMGGDPRATTPEEMRDLVARQYETWKRLATEANISIN